MADAGSHITAHTGLLALFGHPVAHSLSPLIHNAALRHDGLDCAYLAFDVEPVGLEAAVQGLRALRVRGANITVPHKERAAALVDRLEPLAAQVGAVNTIVNDEGILTGHNTDVEGFRSALAGLLGDGARGRRCLVAGAGGAARAVVAALVADGASDVWLYNRTVTRAEELCVAANGWGGTRCTVVARDILGEMAASADIVVNATTVGLDPAVKGGPFVVDIVRSHHVVMDLVYGPATTDLVRQARKRGAAAVDGLEMLLMQAAGSYQLWTGRRPSLDVMRAALASVGR